MPCTPALWYSCNMPWVCLFDMCQVCLATMFMKGPQCPNWIKWAPDQDTVSLILALATVLGYCCDVTLQVQLPLSAGCCCCFIQRDSAHHDAILSPDLVSTVRWWPRKRSSGNDFFTKCSKARLKSEAEHCTIRSQRKRPYTISCKSNIAQCQTCHCRHDTTFSGRTDVGCLYITMYERKPQILHLTFNVNIAAAIANLLYFCHSVQ